MQPQVLIAGTPVVDIWRYFNGRYWFITERTKKKGQYFLSGYVRCLNPAMLAEFQHLPEEVFSDLSEQIEKVPKEAWHRCPYVDVLPNGPRPVVVRCDDPGENARPGHSYSIHCKEVHEKMNIEIQDKLDSYLDLLDEIKQRTGDDETAKVLLGEIAKDLRMEEVRRERPSNRDASATDNQVAYLKDLGAVIPEGLTRRQASRLIEATTATRDRARSAIEAPVRIP